VKLDSNKDNYGENMGTVNNILVAEFEERKGLSYERMVQGGKLIIDMNNNYLIISP
jgi:hypothetical protein